MSSSAENRSIRGHCACGSLRYQIDVSNIKEDLQLAAYCHCSGCQRLNGTPVIWTSHWLYRAVTWDPPPAGPPPGLTEENKEGHFSPNMQTFEQMKGRKWKLRCKSCGSPLGSWNAGTKKWTIWPVTLERRQAMGEEKEDVKADGEFNIPDDIKALIKPNHHQFYGKWKTVIMDDGMEKWTGYQGKSTQVDANGEKIG